MASKRIFRRTALTSGCIALLGVAHLGLGLASGCNDSTTGSRVVFETRVTSDLIAAQPFDNAHGWSVTVDQAIVGIGSLAYVEGAPVALHHRPVLDRPVLDAPPARGWFELPSAHAHPGHYVEGTVLGEVTVPTAVDLLAGEVSLGETDGITGTARSARFVFADPTAASISGAMGDAVAIVSGVARKDGEVDRPFRAVAQTADVLPTCSDIPEVDGCVLDAGSVSGDGTVVLTIAATLWLDQVDFGDLPEPVGGETIELTPGEPAHNAFARGLKKAIAYHFEFVPAQT
jgi:hypothetical protein